jgi:hypothetical protein
MQTIGEAAAAFLQHKRIAVTGVSRQGNRGSNVVYQRLRERGYDVHAWPKPVVVVVDVVVEQHLVNLPGPLTSSTRSISASVSSSASPAQTRCSAGLAGPRSPLTAAVPMVFMPHPRSRTSGPAGWLSG